MNIDALGERARLNYLYARTVIGREFAMPAVQAMDLSRACAALPHS